MHEIENKKANPCCAQISKATPYGFHLSVKNLVAFQEPSNVSSPSRVSDDDKPLLRRGKSIDLTRCQVSQLFISDFLHVDLSGSLSCDRPVLAVTGPCPNPLVIRRQTKRLHGWVPAVPAILAAEPSTE